MTETPELRFFDAIVRAVHARGEDWSLRVIDAAVAALVDDLDSPSLRILAGQPANDEVATERLLLATCEELGIPHPPRRERWVSRVIDGRRWERIASDSIRFAIEPSEASSTGVELCIYINDVSVAASLSSGLHPVDIDHFRVEVDERRALISSCPGCGDSECDWVDIDISPDGKAVHWDWVSGVPNGVDAGVSFPVGAYEKEVERVRADRSWETPMDAARRLVFGRVDHELLSERGVKLDWVGPDHDDPARIRVWLSSLLDRDPEHPFQVFLRFPGDGSPAEASAAEIVRTLARCPEEWRATYLMNNSRDEHLAPSIAGPLWRRRSNPGEPPAVEARELGPIASEPGWSEWLATYVFDPRTRDKTLREIENIDTRADNAKIVTRGIAAGLIVLLGAGVLVGTTVLADGMHDPPLWMRLLLLTFGLLTVLGLGLSIWRIGGGSVARTEVARTRAIEALENDSRRMLPRTVLRDFYVSARVSDSDVWDAAQQLHALDAAWAGYAELRERRNLTLGQELEILEAEASARIVLDAVGELLNPGSAPAEEQW